MSATSKAAVRHGAHAVETWWAAPRRVVLEFLTTEAARAFQEEIGADTTPPRKVKRSHRQHLEVD